MKKMLDEIRSGQYAAGWIKENQTGRHWFEQRRKEERVRTRSSMWAPSCAR